MLCEGGLWHSISFHFSLSLLRLPISPCHLDAIWYTVLKLHLRVEVNVKYAEMLMQILSQVQSHPRFIWTNHKRSGNRPSCCQKGLQMAVIWATIISTHRIINPYAPFYFKPDFFESLNRLQPNPPPEDMQLHSLYFYNICDSFPPTQDTVGGGVSCEKAFTVNVNKFIGFGFFKYFAMHKF